MGLVIRPVAWAPRRNKNATRGRIHILPNPSMMSWLFVMCGKKAGAPLVLSKGKELIAVKIREIAVQHSTPIIEDKHLARSMDVRVEVDRAIRLNFIKR